MSADNSRHAWTNNPILHFGNVETYKSSTDNAVEFYEKQIKALKEEEKENDGN